MVLNTLSAEKRDYFSDVNIVDIFFKFLTLVFSLFSILSGLLKEKEFL